MAALETRYCWQKSTICLNPTFYVNSVGAYHGGVKVSENAEGQGTVHTSPLLPFDSVQIPRKSQRSLRYKAADERAAQYESINQLHFTFNLFGKCKAQTHYSNRKSKKCRKEIVRNPRIIRKKSEARKNY